VVEKDFGKTPKRKCQLLFKKKRGIWAQIYPPPNQDSFEGIFDGCDRKTPHHFPYDEDPIKTNYLDEISLENKGVTLFLHWPFFFFLTPRRLFAPGIPSCYQILRRLVNDFTQTLSSAENSHS